MQQSTRNNLAIGVTKEYVTIVIKLPDLLENKFKILRKFVLKEHVFLLGSLDKHELSIGNQDSLDLIISEIAELKLELKSEGVKVTDIKEAILEKSKTHVIEKEFELVNEHLGKVVSMLIDSDESFFYSIPP